MPSTARVFISLTDTNSATEENVDFVAPTSGGRHERWSIYGGAEEVRFFWPPTGELNLFLQVWQIQPATSATTFKLFFPAVGGWGWYFTVPAGPGKIPLMLRKPPDASGDNFYVLADPFSVEVDAIYF